MIFNALLMHQDYLGWSPVGDALMHHRRLPEEVHPLRKITREDEVIVAHSISGDHPWVNDSNLYEQVRAEAAREIVDLWNAA